MSMIPPPWTWTNLWLQQKWHDMTSKTKYGKERWNRLCLCLRRHIRWVSVRPCKQSECLEAAAQANPQAETSKRGPDTTCRDRNSAVPPPHTQTRLPGPTFLPAPPTDDNHRSYLSQNHPAKLPQISDPQKSCNYSKSVSLGDHFSGRKSKWNRFWHLEMRCYSNKNLEHVVLALRRVAGGNWKALGKLSVKAWRASTWNLPVKVESKKNITIHWRKGDLCQIVVEKVAWSNVEFNHGRRSSTILKVPSSFLTLPVTKWEEREVSWGN